ncbi:MAG TPA: hypothetical protein VFC78_00500 [Tepidisphaeraceae bacterium]|nr:hypothetical protein [Tepidisphaeraceae bacterium]
MNPASSKSMELAAKLIALEAARGRKSPNGHENAARAAGDQIVGVCNKLQRVLTAFAGAAGFRSLLTRALTLARAQDPSSAGVRVLEDGGLAGLETLAAHTSAESAADASCEAGGQLLVAHLLDLLVLFIGEPLTLQMVYSAWPNAPAGAIGKKTKDTP